MSSSFARTALLAGIASLGLVGLASAAPRAPTPPDGPKVEKRVMIMRGGPDGGPRFHRHDPEKHAEHLRDVLQLTPQQEPALRAFVAASQPDVRRERRGPGDEAGKPETERQPLTTPERLDLQARRMAEHQAAFEKRAAATKAFYAQLTASQKKAFDALHPGRGPGFGGPRGRMFGPGGRDHPPMVFGPEDGDLLIGGLDDMDFDPPAPPAAPGT